MNDGADFDKKCTHRILVGRCGVQGNYLVHLLQIFFSELKRQLGVLEDVVIEGRSGITSLDNVWLTADMGGGS